MKKSITLTDCPAVLQSAISEKLQGYAEDSTAYEIISITSNESHIYADKSEALKTYTVILMESNLFTVFRASDLFRDGEYHINVDSIIAGDIESIILGAREWWGKYSTLSFK